MRMDRITARAVLGSAVKLSPPHPRRDTSDKIGQIGNPGAKPRSEFMIRYT